MGISCPSLLDHSIKFIIIIYASMFGSTTKSTDILLYCAVPHLYSRITGFTVKIYIYDGYEFIFPVYWWG